MSNRGQFETEVLRSPVPVLVDFYTASCGPCLQMAPMLEELAQEQAGRWRIVKVNAYDQAELAAQFRISTVPTLLAFRDGRCVAQQVGQVSKRQLQAWLEEA